MMKKVFALKKLGPLGALFPTSVVSMPPHCDGCVIGKKKFKIFLASLR